MRHELARGEDVMDGGRSVRGREGRKDGGREDGGKEEVVGCSE